MLGSSLPVDSKRGPERPAVNLEIIRFLHPVHHSAPVVPLRCSMGGSGVCYLHMLRGLKSAVHFTSRLNKPEVKLADK